MKLDSFTDGTGHHSWVKYLAVLLIGVIGIGPKPGKAVNDGAVPHFNRRHPRLVVGHYPEPSDLKKAGFERQT